jgi:hypothetical protein
MKLRLPEYEKFERNNRWNKSRDLAGLNGEQAAWRALTSVRNHPGMLWHINLLLGNGHERSNYTTAFAVQLLRKEEEDKITMESGVFYSALADILQAEQVRSRFMSESVECVSE